MQACALDMGPTPIVAGFERVRIGPDDDGDAPAEIVSFPLTARPASESAIRKPNERRETGPRARVYQPARSVMQSAPALRRPWVLEFEPESAPFIEPLMGWTGSADTRQQVRLIFPDRESAVAFAERQGYAYTVQDPPRRRRDHKSCAAQLMRRPQRAHSANHRRPS